MSWTMLTDTDRETLITLYNNCGTTCDDLPYTGEFDRLYAAFIAETRRQVTPHEFWRALVTARKTSRLDRKER